MVVFGWVQNIDSAVYDIRYLHERRKNADFRLVLITGKAMALLIFQ